MSSWTKYIENTQHFLSLIENTSQGEVRQGGQDEVRLTPQTGHTVRMTEVSSIPFGVRMDQSGLEINSVYKTYIKAPAN